MFLHADPDAIRSFLDLHESVVARALEQLSELAEACRELVDESWTGDQSEVFTEDFFATAASLSAALEAHDEAARSRRRIVEALEQYLAVPSGSHSPSVSTTVGHAASVTTANGAPDKFLRAARGRQRPGLTGHRVHAKKGRFLDLWDFSGMTSEDIDWGGDPRFPEGFRSGAPHHGNDPAYYRSLVAQLPGVLRRTQAHGLDSVEGDPAAERVRDVFLGDEPVEIVLRGRHKPEFRTGRHRGLAAIEAGAILPVNVVRTSCACTFCKGDGGGQ